MKTKTIKIGICLIILLLGISVTKFSSLKAANATFTVNDFATLKQAITNANDGDIIEFKSFTGNITEALQVSKSLTFTSESGPIALKVSGNFRHINITGNDVTLNFKDVILDGNNVGGGISKAIQGGNITINKAHVKKARAVNGGGLSVAKNTILIVNDSTFDYNIANNYGGGIFTDESCNVTINNTTVDNNTANGSSAQSGGGLLFAAYGNITINNSNITNNTGYLRGGGINAIRPSNAAIVSNTGNLTVNNSYIYNNNASVHGGGVYLDVGWKGTIKDTDIDKNTSANYSAGILVTEGVNLYIEGGSITNNIATNGGGAIGVFFNSKVYLEGGTTIYNNQGKLGGAIYAAQPDSLVDVKNTIFEKNKATNGGAIYTTDLKNTFVDSLSTFVDNSATTSTFWTIGNGEMPISEPIHLSNIASSVFTNPFTNAYNNNDINLTTNKVTFKANGGTGSDKYINAEAKGKITFIQNPFIPPLNMRLSKWNNAPDGSGTQSYTPGETITMGNTSMIFYAIYEIDYIHIPDTALSKVIYDELIRLGRITSVTPNNNYFFKADLETITSLTYNENTQNSKNYGKIKSLENFNYLINMEYINFGYNEISDVTSLSSMKKLKEINFEFNNITNIDSISDSPNLSKIIFYNNNITDISKLNNIPNLTSMYMAMNKIADISSIKNFAKLTIVDFFGNEIKNIEPVASLLQLTDLNLGYNKYIEDITPIKDLKNIINLNLSTNNISDISIISNLKNTNLKDLYLYDNKIVNISPISSIQTLETLDLSQNNISDVSSINSLSSGKLEYLKLSQNKIADISCIESLLNKPNLSFNGKDQVVNIGVTRINGYEYELFNIIKTISTGQIDVSNISGSGNIDTSTGIIKWTDLKADFNPISFSFKDSSGIKFDGIVTASLERVIPMDPKSPNNKNIGVDPNGIPDFTGLGKAELTINYIEPLDFGIQDITAGDMNIEAVTKTPYIQVADLRKISEGWRLKLSASELKNTQSNNIIEGVQLQFKKGEVKSSPINNINIPNIVSDIVVPLNNTTEVDVMNATAGKGSGIWLGIWDSVGTRNENVIMKVPSGKARIGQYETTLTWQLLDTP